MKQKLIPGVISGLIIGIIGAMLWAVITVAAEYQIGYMSIAIGIVVGWTIRIFGNGTDQIFGFWGAAISLFSILLGNFLSIIGFIANFAGLGYIETLSLVDYREVLKLTKESFQPIDFLFYGLAIFAGYMFSFRKITEKKITELE